MLRSAGTALAGLLVAGMAVGMRPPVAAAGDPDVYSVVEGVDAASGHPVVLLHGRSLTRVRTIALRNPSDQSDAGPVTLHRRTTRVLVLGLREDLAQGTYDLVLGFGTGETVLPLVIDRRRPLPGTVGGESLSEALRADLADADTLGGHDGAWYADASHLSEGTLSADRFSAFEDLGTEERIGIGPDQVAPGDHLHDDRYPLLEHHHDAAYAPLVHDHDADYVRKDGDAMTGTLAVETDVASIVGTSTGDYGSGIEGRHSSVWSGTGVAGYSDAYHGIGVYGETTGEQGWGVSGVVSGASGAGVLGYGPVGVLAASPREGGTGLFVDVSQYPLTASPGFLDVGTGIAVQLNALSGTGVFSEILVPGLGFGRPAETSSICAVTNANNTVGILAVNRGTGGAGLKVRGGQDLAVFQSAAGTTVARIDSAGKGYFNGGTQSSGADFAESVAVERSRGVPEPGDVMAIAKGRDRTFEICAEPESPLVAGVHSTMPGFLGTPRAVAGPGDDAGGEIPLAVVGIVPVKVCDEGGPIDRGDLLVSASVPGHAKRAPADPRPGTLLGKALGRLEARRGTIEVYLMAR